MTLSFLLAFFVAQAFAYTPSAVNSSSDTSVINNNFLDIANEIERRSLVTGGTINGTLTVSGNLTSNGTNTFTGGNAFGGSSTFTGTTAFTGPVLGLSSYSCVNLTGVAGASQAGLNIGIVGSTVSLTGSTFTVRWAASVCDGTGPCSNANKMGLGFIVDGTFESPMSMTVACIAGNGGGGAGSGAPLYCERVVTRAYGSHTFAATWDNISGNNNDSGTCDPVSTCQFCVHKSG